jgi:predicted RNA-binding Zn-ribbon protein involved in translation (DUF1610 family)
VDVAGEVVLSRSSYHQVGALATHPAFSSSAVAVVCPLCADGQVFETRRVGEYDRHFLTHDPTMEQAERWMSGRTFERVGIEKGWLPICDASGTPATQGWAPCPVCGDTGLRVTRGRLCRHVAREVLGRSALPDVQERSHGGRVA